MVADLSWRHLCEIPQIVSPILWEIMPKIPDQKVLGEFFLIYFLCSEADIFAQKLSMERKPLHDYTNSLYRLLNIKK